MFVHRFAVACRPDKHELHLSATRDVDNSRSTALGDDIPHTADALWRMQRNVNPEATVGKNGR
jgi:hypothetical protein